MKKGTLELYMCGIHVGKSRAIELYHKDSPFKPKMVKSKKTYTRKTKHKDKE